MRFTSKTEVYRIYLSLCIFLMWLEPGSSKFVESCSDGCPVYQMQGVDLPLLNSDYSISVWQEPALEIFIWPGNNDYLRGPREGTWYDITTTRKDGQSWVSAPDLLPKEFRADFTKLILKTKVGVKTLWKLNCRSATCGCRHFRLIALFLDLKALPVTLYWWPGEEGGRLKANKWHKSVGNENEIVSSSNKWHDITVDRSPEGTLAAVRSISLNFTFENISLTSELTLGGVNNTNEPQPSFFALGCKEAPQGDPNPASFDAETDKETDTKTDTETDKETDTKTDTETDKETDTKTDTETGTHFYMMAIGIPLLAIIVVALVVFVAMKTRSSKSGGCQPPASRPHDTGVPSPDDTRPDAEDNEYCEIDMVALRVQLAKEERQRAKGDMAERVSTGSHESENSLYWEDMKRSDK